MLQNAPHSSQINTSGPAMSVRTSCWLLWQNEQYITGSEMRDLPPYQMAGARYISTIGHESVRWLWEFYPACSRYLNNAIAS
jgi:hypothetical protein